MKQVWIGIGILGALLLGGIWMGNTLEQAQTQQIRDLEQAEAAARAENWNLAEAHLTRAKKEWEKKRNFSSTLYRQDTLDQIDGFFAQLEANAACRDREGFCENCALLAKCLQNLPQSHSFHWRNLL